MKNKVESITELEQDILKRGMREGIEIEKGAVLTKEYIEAHEDLFRKYGDFFSAYPDVFLDLIKPTESSFSLFFYQRIILRAIMRFKEVYVIACVKGDTPILTEKGMVPIKDFNPNDRVWSNGEWRYPENLNGRDWNDNLVKLFAEGCFEDEITVTDNHRFWAIKDFDRRKKSAQEIAPEWIEAKDLTLNDYLLSSIDLEVKDIKFISMPPQTGHFEPSQIKIDKNFYEWLGIWLSRGSWQNNTINFTIHENENRLKKRICSLTKKVFNLKATICPQENQTLILQINNPQLDGFLEKLFGCYPEDISEWDKWIPPALLRGEPKKQLQLVKGWLDGNGHYEEPSKYAASTASNLLIEGVKNILHRNFINPSITTTTGEDKVKIYNLDFDGLLAKEFKDAINENRPVEIDETMRSEPHHPVSFGEKTYMTGRVSYIEILPPDGETVYCLQMENGMFNVNGVEGHNCRAFSKSFLTILAEFLQCVFIPGTKRFICAPNKNQAAQIAKEKLYEIYELFPLLRKEVIGGEISDTPGNFGKDYVTIKFRNKSQFDVVGALDSQRGGRRHGGLVDEIRDHDEIPLNEIVLPLMNVSRRLPDNTVNEREPNQQVIYMTSAGNKVSFAYEKLIDVFENSIIDPKNAFVFGCDYRIPVLHGLIDRTYINKLKMSPSYNQESFAREYLSLWSGSSTESWFNYDKLQRYRKIKNPETHFFNRPNSVQFYMLSVDVGRINDQTVCCVFRVNVAKGKFLSTLVNIYVLGRSSATKPFSIQAIDLKKIIKKFNPREVVIDINGLGVGLADEMIRPQVDVNGEIFPAYGFHNDKEYLKIQPREAVNILYGIKANGPLNSQIHGNAFSRLTSGKVRFLIKEQEAKSALLSTKVGQKMSVEKRVERLMPHEMTTKLFEEMANLRLKRTGASLDISLEQINSRYPKDKYSAFAYGLWRIKELEEQEYTKTQRRGQGVRKLVFFSGGE